MYINNVFFTKVKTNKYCVNVYRDLSKGSSEERTAKCVKLAVKLCL